MNYGVFDPLVRKQVDRLRPLLFNESRTFDWANATVKVALPGVMAILCFLALNPHSWDVSDGIVRFLQFFKLFSLVIMVAMTAYTALMAVAVYEVHTEGWTAPVEPEDPFSRTPFER